MKTKYFILALSMTFLGMVSCKNAPESAKVLDNDQPNTYGAGVTNAENPLPLNAFIAQLETQDTVNAIVRAKVSEVCQMKGCWMNLVDSNGEAADELFVKFKDYAFFVPMDISGREVIIEGIGYTEETSVEELRHYAEDEGKSAEEIAAITEPSVQKKFMATGVVLVDAPSAN